MQVKSIVAREASRVGAQVLTLNLGLEELQQPQGVARLVQLATRQYRCARPRALMCWPFAGICPRAHHSVPPVRPSPSPDLT